MSIFTSYKLPTTIIPNSVPSADWGTPDNILLVDDLFATASGPANILTVGTFNPAVPYGATILGITLQVKGFRGVNPVNLSIYAVDDITGVTYSYPLTPPFSGFDGTNTLYTLTATLFSTTWDSDQINNIKFRLIADNELNLDAILMRVEYIPAVVPPPIPTPAADIVVDEFVQAQPFNFAMALSATDLFLFLETFTYPNGVPIQFADFHTTNEAYLTLDQGIPFKEENVRITNVEQDYGGSGLCRISFGSLANRGLNFQWDYTTDSSRRVTHDSTAKAVISNSAPFYSRFLRIAQIGGLVSAPITVQDEGVDVSTAVSKFNFAGAGVTVTEVSPGFVLVTIPGGGGGSGITSINSDTTAAQTLIAGTGITITNNGTGGHTITASGTGTGQIAIQFQDEGSNLGSSGTADTVNFVGAGVTATRVSNVVTVTIPSSGVTSLATLTQTITQTSHGFSVGDIIRSSGTAGQYTKAKADVTTNAEVVGIVTTVVNANSFIVTTSGYFTTGVPAQAAGTIMFLSDATAGLLTVTEPTTSGTVSKPLVTIITNAAIGFFQNYRGIIN